MLGFMVKRPARKQKKRATIQAVDTVRASRGGHTFHERWAARRALQLVFPKDGLRAIAVEGLSAKETANLGAAAEEVADLVLYFGAGENFASAEAIQTVQFKYKTTPGPVTASYLRKTIEKFVDTILGYEREFSIVDVDKKLTFAFITNAEFAPELWKAIKGLKSHSPPIEKEALSQHDYLAKLCAAKNLDAHRLFSRCEFRASEEALPALNSSLRRTIVDWSAGADLLAQSRIFGLVELLREKAGPLGQGKNLIRREEVLVALSCEPEDLFPADTRFIDVGEVISRKQLLDATNLIKGSEFPIFIHADGGVGKTVFVETLASAMSDIYDVVVFDCFGGGAYRSPDQARHLPNVGFVQLTNELASRGLCDPLLPGDTESVALVNAMRRRLVQAVSTLKLQSKKEGLLIIIDAADNAQLEAEDRKDDAFPKLLLSSLSGNVIEGVKLVLTARTHRMSRVVARSKVTPFELLPFLEEETKGFLTSRRSKVSNTEFVTAFSRSGGNARVLTHLIETWDTNVAGNVTKSKITVEQLIAEKCRKIFADLHLAGWPDEDVREFFAAIALLPPPIPLEELAGALGWEKAQVNSAASDLAPMLEIIPTHGAIFRDEPTETYVHDTYSHETASQQAIAQRLQDAQLISPYAAEALPNFLVAIGDSSRAYALANSLQFPAVIQSDFGRRRLTLARLNAAFKLAVKGGDFDRVLGVAMRLAQVAAANSRGDEFIRRSPSMAVVLGDRDAYRRLFSDRSGWRGARDARLAVAHAFSKEMEEAEIHCDRAIGWINWNARQPTDEHDTHSQRGPDKADFAAILFLGILQGNFGAIDNNLCSWNRSFALSVSREAIKLARQYECATSIPVIESLAAFASTANCKSFALKTNLLSIDTALPPQKSKLLSRSLKAMNVKPETSNQMRENVDGDVIYAAFAALMCDGPSSAARILRAVELVRPSSYDYGERYGIIKSWLPILHACVAAWSQKRPVAIHDLLPHDVKVTRAAKAISTQTELIKFLAALKLPRRTQPGRKRSKKITARKFDEHECQKISRGIEIVLQVIGPLQESMFTHKTSNRLDDFLTNWQKYLPQGTPRQFEEAHHQLSRTIGFGFTQLLLRHTLDVTDADAAKLIDIISNQRFTIHDRSSVLSLFASKPRLHTHAGVFAQSIAIGIRKDDSTEQRGEDYASLAEALLRMSVAEAREYYRNGLSELDKLGSNDYDLIYAILNYAAAQSGGLIRPELGHRFMNLSQTICAHDSRKFGWTLFAKASARSVGTTAATKLIRWHDQDVADFSYGLPQLACFLSIENRLSPQRAAALLMICEEHGWHDWRLGDGLADLLTISTNADERRIIFTATFRKLKIEHSNGGWPSVWKSLLDLSEKFPGTVNENDTAELRKLLTDAEKTRDDFNSNSYSGRVDANISNQIVEINPESFLIGLVSKCDPASSLSIDEALDAIEAEPSLPYFTRTHFFNKMRETCAYDKRLGHLFALAEATNITVSGAIDQIRDCFAVWAPSSAHIVAEAKNVIERLFKSKGSELFNLQYGSVSRELSQLTDLCGDADFVLHQALNTIVTERVELNGEEWLQLATTLCKQASPAVAREALEDLLSGPAAGLADGIGEGPYQPSFFIEDECALISGIVWHLLGDSDAYVRWATARALSAFVELGLFDELNVLLDQFDRIEIPALKSAEQPLSFQNSQQWFLMGLARAALKHGAKLTLLKPRLLTLAARPDLHVLHKQHILRCLINIGSDSNEIASLKTLVSIDPKGCVVAKGWPKPTKAESGFTFDYEFMKSEISQLSRLFGISDGESTDAIAEEIKRRWPEAPNMDFFPGHDRYSRDRSDRQESYREHLQKHALLSAATTLRCSRPVVRQSYDQERTSVFRRWLADYDVTFDDGSWLADHKDAMLENAKANFLRPRIENKELIIEAKAAFDRLGLTSSPPGTMIPIFGQWRSPDNVYIRIDSALGVRRGIVGLCNSFSKRKDHDLWLPMFGDEGVDDPYRQKRPFESFIWAPENNGLGVDAGEESATGGPASRPRLGVELTTKFGLSADAECREWRMANGGLALRSQVWGQWVPDSDNRHHRHNEHGEVLWASSDWLDHALPRINRQLVYMVTLQKYKESRSYSEASGAKAIYVGTRPIGKNVRFWFAKRASATMY